VSGLLEGVRVVEAASLMNGDFVGMALGDLGAEVIKVEDCVRGDYMRDILGQISPRNSPAHLHLNRNKRSIALDLHSSEDRAIFWQLLVDTDVFVDGFMPGATQRLGIDFEQQRKRKPDIIYCQATGFGATGPYANIPTHGRMQSALAGAFPLETAPDGSVGMVRYEPSIYGSTKAAGYAAAPAIAGIWAALYVVSAIVARDRTGEGCYLDVAASDAIIATGWSAPVYTLNWDRLTDKRDLPDRPLDPEFEARVKYQFYETSDLQYVLFACSEPKFWNCFCAVVGREDLADHSDTALDFAVDEASLRTELTAIIGSRTSTEWVSLAIEHHLPIGPSPLVADLPSDPHLSSREIFREYVHPTAGAFTDVAPPVLVSDDRWELRYPAPSHGEHSDQIRAELAADGRGAA
jgi:crotonobetainyl-CoA:carnitine CoA-transferase CaiB-like acyl-CoA transferase